jgi:imidazolonepropionase-like amidohydrolase
MATLKIKTTRLFDGERLRAEQPLNIIVRGDRVAEVSGQSTPQATSDDFHEIDATSLTILPGLIDAHFHPVSASTPAEKSFRVDS